MPVIKVAGEVHLLGWEGKRVSFWENVHANGKDYSRLWTAWFAEPQTVQEQDFVEIAGELSTKIGEYTNKQGEKKTVVEHHLQNALIAQHRSKAEADAFAEEMPF